MTENIQEFHEKRRVWIRRVSTIILLIIIVSFMRRPILSSELSELTTYWWTEQQEVSEPDVYQFYKNGKVRIYNYSSDIICNWSYREGTLYIWKYSIFRPVYITYTNIRIEHLDNRIYMYTDTNTFYTHVK